MYSFLWRYIGVIGLLLVLGHAMGQSNKMVFSQVDASVGLSDNQIRYILQLNDGRMMFTTKGNVNLYDGINFRYIHRTEKDVFPLESYHGHYRVYPGRDSLIWIKDFKKLMVIDIRKERYINISETPLGRKVPDNSIDDLFADSDKQIWGRKGDRLLQLQGDLVIDLNNVVGDLQDLTSDKSRLYLFFSTGELRCYDRSSGKFLFTRHCYTINERRMFDRTSLVVSGRNELFQIRNGQRGGVFMFSKTKKEFTKVLETSYTLNTLAIKSDSVIYVSCLKGLWVINVITGYKQLISDIYCVDGDRLQVELSTVFTDFQNGLWVGTLNRGLLYYNPSSFRFQHIDAREFPIGYQRDVEVTALAEDSKGNIYLKSNGTVFSYRATNDGAGAVLQPNSGLLSKEVLEQLYRHHDRAGLKDNETTKLVDSRGWIWTGTHDGLKLWYPGLVRPKIFYTGQGIINNAVRALLEDESGDIWLTTSSGISKIKVPKGGGGHLSITSFNSLSGTLKDEYTEGAALRSRTGRIFFGGVNGFTIFDEKVKQTAVLSVSPIFTALYLKGHRVLIDSVYDGRTIMNKAAPYTEKLVFAHYQNDISLEFAALNFQNPALSYYRYRVLGLSPEWLTAVTAQHHDRNAYPQGILRLSYNNMPPGNYLVQVQASADNAVWNGKILELQIVVQTPWWKTPIAYSLYIFITLILLYVLVNSYMRRAKRKLEIVHQEEILLLKIRNLIDQCAALEAEKEILSRSTYQDQDLPPYEGGERNPADEQFLARAMEAVEKNLDDPNYSVEKMSKDLFMDRTGLYRKLVSLLDKSPSLFIRNIRLQRAAALLLEGRLSVSEISVLVGFSSPGYLARCFQEKYGCKPSEYAAKGEKST